ncbi:uncharacterized protein FOMMEDRAFT_147616 [Fomitiporia mediterranea MF3/22]|uniref:uncharacterized protein n=1 Tax=Fomitiporia mediterranea (strain MF3/22) TaxID=694068 RepID=UPI00044072BB|nr:uncharacterized protein FOMMEDRAFT_147616 [Fomitiporia mediterranea MF3/22]EJD00923.1 hypothetical protein FOMMEDRAFT_147616 [Fomitiporia mediterranea MF3/22]
MPRDGGNGKHSATATRRVKRRIEESDGNKENMHQTPKSSHFTPEFPLFQDSGTYGRPIQRAKAHPLEDVMVAAAAAQTLCPHMTSLLGGALISVKCRLVQAETYQYWVRVRTKRRRYESAGSSKQVFLGVSWLLRMITSGPKGQRTSTGFDMTRRPESARCDQAKKKLISNLGQKAIIEGSETVIQTSSEADGHEPLLADCMTINRYASSEICHLPIPHSPYIRVSSVTTLLALSSLSGANALADSWSGDVRHAAVFARDEHAHAHGHNEPLVELNETLILQWHKPTPPSYGTHDFEDPNVTHKYPHLMALHGIALRSVKHAWHGVSVAVFYGLVASGLSFSALYRKLTPNLYENAKHGPHGYFVLFCAATLTTIDALAALTRTFHFLNSVRRGEITFSIKRFWRVVVLNREDVDSGFVPKRFSHEYAGLVQEPDELEMDAHELKSGDDAVHIDLQAGEMSPGFSSPVSDGNAWPNEIHEMRRQHRERHSTWRQSVASDRTLFHAHPSRHGSHHSDETLHELPPHIAEVKPPLAVRVGRGVFATAERILVFMGYMQFITGLVAYTGVCRDSYVNGCLAHLIKGGIFWCYGLVTFARFLGSFAELGWAWNRAPRAINAPTAEFVESLVIFVYGASNTWMERFGAKAGDPFTTKEIQHISIAVMFWFAGLVGMGIESKTFRNWLAAHATALAAESSDHPEELAPPPSYRGSFNPFPALTIGVTGLAMAAHAQVYLFQVQIHMLWGQLLAGFSLLRCLTYFFLWLSPPSSILPSRPPTEALGSFFLACGGLMFQMSLEELDLAAMRRGHDDMMMFLNFAVAVTCLAFCWVLFIVTFKAWLRVRESKKAAARKAAMTA